VNRVNYPTIDGLIVERNQELRLDASRYRTIEVERLNGPATAGLVLGIAAAVAAPFVVFLIGLSGLR